MSNDKLNQTSNTLFMCLSFRSQQDLLQEAPRIPLRYYEYRWKGKGIYRDPNIDRTLPPLPGPKTRSK